MNNKEKLEGLQECKVCGTQGTKKNRLKRIKIDGKYYYLCIPHYEQLWNKIINFLIGGSYYDK